MVRAVIIDDERNSRDIITLMLEKYCPGVEPVATAANCREGIALIRELRPQLVFLDLEMPDGTGFDVLTGAYDETFEAVFVTAFEKRFLHTIRFAEVELILKPIDKESLVATVDKVLQRINTNASKQRYEVLLNNFSKEENDEKNLIIPAPDGAAPVIPISMIDYLEGAGDKVVFHLQDSSILPSTHGFRFYAELFNAMKFYQVNNQQIVQLSHITKVDADRNLVLLKSGASVEVTERRKKELLALWR
ncbi:LytTR family DNA-binding domain-containing protein [Chitinophaga horti]|uniref:LytTR family DNA-binding domain-containing protein n=1 Tax=Chitinophaga horti TaxID=2920382 RepID=A0ABY6IZ21_9BACT|nr:LytTR family DNA-binding domain-containing protein [Chitinophaga horti]UYQ92530.1 LytTR family DNA-binding domain-containing protein [Chitinophaga horti]